MKTFNTLTGLLFLLLSAGCSKHAQEDPWWTSMTSARNEVVQVMTLAPHEKKSLVISGNGQVHLGVLVREVEEMRTRLHQAGDDRGGVFLTQNNSGKYVGTYYSASVQFLLSEGTEFSVENRSPVASDVLVYQDPDP